MSIISHVDSIVQECCFELVLELHVQCKICILCYMEILFGHVHVPLHMSLEIMVDSEVGAIDFCSCCKLFIFVEIPV